MPTESGRLQAAPSSAPTTGMPPGYVTLGATDALSDGARQILGLPADASAEAAFFDAVHPDDRGALELLLDPERPVDGDHSRQQVRLRRADGVERVVEVTRVPDELTRRPTLALSDRTDELLNRDRLLAAQRTLVVVEEIASIGSWVWVQENQRATWSPNLYRIMGVEPGAEHTTEEFLGLVHPDDRERVSAAAQASPEQGTIDFRIVRRADGETRNLTMTWRGMVRPAAGPGDPPTMVEMTGIIIDTTEREAMESALRESEERWRSIAENPFDYVVLVDRDGTFQYVNRVAEGINREDLIGKASMFDFVQVGIEDARKALDTVFNEGKPSYYESYTEAIDGWTGNVLGPVRRNGEVVAASILCRDITPQKRAERELRHNERMLSDAQRIAGVGCWQLEMATGRLSWSDEMYRITGVEPGTPPTVELYHSLVHPNDLDLVLAEAETALATGRSEPHEYRICRASDGEWRHVQTAGEVIREAHGKVVGFIGTTLDITDRRRLEERLAQSQKLEALGRLAGGVAHDFNNVLTAIICNAEFAARDLPPDSHQRDLLDAINSAANRAAGLTRQLLAFSRRQIVKPTVIDVNAHIREFHRLADRVLGDDITMDLSLADDASPVRMDPAQLEQVLMNLAVNARDAMPDGGRLVIETCNVDATVDDEVGTIEHPGLPAGRYLQIAVSDTGVGMDDATRRHAFDPFFSTKDEMRGSGLGLATCHGVVTQAGGFIWLYSEPGLGTTFRIHLPAVNQPVEPAAPAPTPKAGGGGETILVVEDHDLVRRLCVQSLETLGYRARVATTGEEALHIGRELGPSLELLLTDVVLPDMRGPKIVEGLRPSCPNMRVLLASGYSGTAMTATAGMHFLSKPYSPATLGAAVRTALDSDPAPGGEAVSG